MLSHLDYNIKPSSKTRFTAESCQSPAHFISSSSNFSLLSTKTHVTDNVSIGDISKAYSHWRRYVRAQVEPLRCLYFLKYIIFKLRSKKLFPIAVVTWWLLSVTQPARLLLGQGLCFVFLIFPPAPSTEQAHLLNLNFILTKYVTNRQRFVCF